MFSTTSTVCNNDIPVPSRVSVPTSQDKCDVTATLVASLLLIVSLSLVINYVIHPVPPMIQITADFALSLPVVVCGSISMGLIVTLLVQICRNQSVAEAFSRTTHASVRSRIHMGGRPDCETVSQYAEAHQATIEYTEEMVGDRISFETRDGVQLTGYWNESDSPCMRPTVLLFHGNNGSASTMTDWGYYYKQLGFNVLMVEYRGYGLSEGTAGGPNQELEAYLDAEAALKFVLSKNIPKSNVVAHGLSLGGAYAAALGYFFGVEHIILDHTFTTIGSICGNWVPVRSWDNLISSSYVQTQLDKHPDIPDASDLVTDGFNTLAKVQQMTGNIFVICGKKDRMMPLRFGQELIQARYPGKSNTQQNYLVTLEGGHNYDFKLFHENRAAQQKHWAFLYNVGVWDQLNYSELVNWDLLRVQGKAKFQEGDRGFVF
jgi:esterase/lipase